MNFYVKNRLKKKEKTILKIWSNWFYVANYELEIIYFPIGNFAIYYRAYGSFIITSIIYLFISGLFQIFLYHG